MRTQLLLVSVSYHGPAPRRRDTPSRRPDGAGRWRGAGGNGAWFVKRIEHIHVENKSCYAAVFVENSHSSILLTMCDDEDTDQLCVKKIDFLESNKGISIKDYDLEAVHLHDIPGVPDPSMRWVMDRRGEPRTSMCLELLPSENNDTTISRDGTPIALQDDGAIHILLLESVHPSTGECNYTFQMTLDSLQSTSICNLGFSQNSNALCARVGKKEICIFDLCKRTNGDSGKTFLECSGKHRFADESNEAGVYGWNGRYLLYTRPNTSNAKCTDILTRRCDSEARDALLDHIQQMFVDPHQDDGNHLLQLVHSVIADYRYDESQWPEIPAWIQHEFSEFLQNSS